MRNTHSYWHRFSHFDRINLPRLQQAERPSSHEAPRVRGFQMQQADNDENDENGENGEHGENGVSLDSVTERNYEHSSVGFDGQNAPPERQDRFDDS